MHVYLSGTIPCTSAAPTLPTTATTSHHECMKHKGCKEYKKWRAKIENELREDEMARAAAGVAAPESAAAEAQAAGEDTHQETCEQA